jgi:CTP:molybdopterin cytidylyltransferase MocA
LALGLDVGLRRRIAAGCAVEVNSAGLILAAGESRRMGTPKALLDYRGETFLNRLVRLFSAKSSPVIVVLGAGADSISVPAAARAVVNRDWPLGQTTSMQCGLRALPPEADGVLFTLVDHPAVSAATVDALLSASGRLRIPRFDGRRGHPIWFSRDLIPEILAVPPDGAARDAIRSYYPEATFLDVDDPGVLADIDDRAAYRALLEAEA